MKYFGMVITISLLLNLSVEAKALQAESKFLSKDDDKLSFIKKQLISNAFKMVIDKKLKEMNLDSTTFWQNYNAKFEENFSKIKDSLRAKYQPDPEKEIPSNMMEQYESTLRKKRLISKSRYGRLSRVIKSYSIEKFSKSIALPNSHYIKLNANVDEKRLAEVYYKFIGVSSIRAFDKVFVDTKIILKNITWTELGVTTQNDFLNVLNKSWREKIELKAGDIFSGGVQVVDNIKRDEINKQLEMSSKISDTLNSPDAVNEISDSLYVKSIINIKNIDFDEQTMEYFLHFSGGMLIFDLKNGSVVNHLDFPPVELKFTRLDDHSFSSSIAQAMFEMALPVVDNFRKVVEENVKLKQNFELAIEGAKNLDEVYQIQKILKELGVLYFFNPEISEVNNSVVIMNVNYSGVKEKAFAVLNKLENLKIDEERQLLRKNNLPFSFELKSVELKGDNKSKEVNQNSGVNL